MADALELELETPLPIDTIIKGDCIEEMKKLPSNSFDVAIIDLPITSVLAETGLGITQRNSPASVETGLR